MMKELIFTGQIGERCKLKWLKNIILALIWRVEFAYRIELAHGIGCVVYITTVWLWGGKIKLRHFQFESKMGALENIVRQICLCYLLSGEGYKYMDILVYTKRMELFFLFQIGFSGQIFGSANVKNITKNQNKKPKVLHFGFIAQNHTSNLKIVDFML
jgi:hypothetical protein